MVGTAVDRAGLTKLLEDFYTLTGIRISFWDTDEHKRVAGPIEGNSRFCSALRRIPEFDENCCRYDRQALKAARRSCALHTFRCAAGLREYVYPAVYEQKLLGFFMFGQVRVAGEDEQTETVRQALYRQYDLDEREMGGLYQELPPMTHAKMLAAARMLTAMAGYAYLNGLVRRREQPLAARIDQYIVEHLGESLKLDEAGRSLHVSRSTISHTLRANLGLSFVELVNRHRIECVGRCLRQGDSMAAAARTAGYANPAYCSRVFRKIKGMTPQHYRQFYQHDQEEEPT